MTDITFKAADYTTIRNALVDLHMRIIKKPNTDEIKTCAKHLGLWHQKALSLNNDNELDLLADYRMYAFRPHGFNMAERYLRINKSKLSDYDQALLMRMSLARYAVYQIEANNHTDEFTATDVLLKTQFKLIDHGLATSGTIGMVIGSHLIDLGDFFIQTGAPLPLNSELLEVDEVIMALERINEEHYIDDLLNPVNNSKLARAIISASIRLGFTENVAYR